MIKKRFFYVFLLLYMVGILSTCKSNKINIEPVEGITCLFVDYRGDYINKSFNPEWLAQHKINRVIAKSYYNNNGIIEKRKGFSIFDFNEMGYLKCATATSRKPDIKDEDDLIVKHFYTYEEKDSFLIRNYRQVRFIDLNGNKIESDSLPDLNLKSVINFQSAKVFYDENPLFAKEYTYDKNERLVEIRNGKGEVVTRYNYISNSEIEIVTVFLRKEKIRQIKLNELGQIIESFDRSENFSYKYRYDKRGALIQKSWYKEGVLHTFEKFKYYN